MTKCLTIQSLLVPRSSIRSFSRFQIDDVGEEYCHFPIHYDEEYFKMLTAEHCVTRFHKGVARREWVLKKGQRRNETLDMFVYNFVALNKDVNHCMVLHTNHIPSAILYNIV